MPISMRAKIPALIIITQLNLRETNLIQRNNSITDTVKLFVSHR